jgi:hypothetical protein
MADTDYGTLVTIAGVTLKVINVEPPELSTDIIQTTNHSSGGWREYIADTLKGAAAFTITAEGSGAMVEQLETVWAARVAVAIVFTEYGFPAWSFNGLIKSFKLNPANAQSPNEAIASITIQPTGAMTIAAAAGNWYTDVSFIYFDVGGLYTIAHPGTHQLVVYGVIPGLPPFALSAAEIAACTFASSVAGKATVSAAGLITTVATGATTVSAYITAKSAVETVVNVTVS